MAEQTHPSTTLSLVRELGLTEEEVGRRKAFLDFLRRRPVADWEGPRAP
ncbi:MAG: hypothetical protein AB1671_11885 [Thermodesulfobacteriota bacterium]|jgi:hypothetical protein